MRVSVTMQKCHQHDSNFVGRLTVSPTVVMTTSGRSQMHAAGAAVLKGD